MPEADTLAGCANAFGFLSASGLAYADRVNAIEIFYTGLLVGMTGVAGAFGLYVLYRLKG